MYIYIYTYISNIHICLKYLSIDLSSFHHTTCESTCDARPSLAANQW